MARSIQLLEVMLCAAAMIWAADPAVGTWKLNLAKSKYVPGPAPRSQTRVYAEAPDGMKATVTTLNRDGRTFVEEYAANYDGVEHAVTGDPYLDGIIMKKVDAFTAESTLIHAGVVLGMAKRTVSADGKTMTITYQGTLGGQKVNNIGVYDKQ
jgi:hypothetical protein